MQHSLQAFATADIGTWVLMWGIAAMFLLVRYWRFARGVGLILTYVVSFGSIHWLAAALYVLPWYSASGEGLVAEGMKLSAIALVSFAVGAEIVYRWLSIHRERRPQTRVSDDAHAEVSRISPFAASWYLAAGVFLYAIVTPFAGRLPTLTALVNTGSAVIVLGISLKCWNAWQSGRPNVWWWLMATAILPLITVATQGFLGYGMAAVVTVYGFTAAFYRPRWVVLTASLVIAYLGLSVYVTYMRDRGDIRATVWSGTGLSDRFSKVRDSLGNFEWFSIDNQDHLARIDSRLNQDWLVGAAVANIRRGNVDYARGTTYRDAALALIPRAIWKDKPVGAGSGDLVSIYTGIPFAEGTSVGIGQVMETFVNFGQTGVIIAFLIIGGVLAIVDRFALESLARGDVGHFAMWYLPGLSLLNLGGSFVEITSSAGAGFAMAYIMNVLIRRRLHLEAMAHDRIVAMSSHPPETVR